MDPRDRGALGWWMLILAGITAVAVVFEFPSIWRGWEPVDERLEALTADRVADGYAVEFNGRDGYLTVPAGATDADAAQVAAAIAEVDGVRDVEWERDAAEPEPPTPTEPDGLDPAAFELTWNGAERDGSGVIPADDEPILAAALNFEGFEPSVDHALEPDIRDSVEELGDYLGAELPSGRLEVLDDELTVEAEALDADTLAEVEDRFGGRSGVDLLLTVPEQVPADFEVDFDADGATQRGDAPVAVTDALAALGVDPVATAPEIESNPALEAGLSALADEVAAGRLAEGSAIVDQGVLSVVAQATSSDARDAARAALAGDVDSLELSLTQEAAAEEASAAIDAVFAELGRIEFVTGTATPTPETEGLLDEIADVLNEFLELDVEVAGHTDATGDPDLNQQLSQDRADAVVAGLVERGVDEERLEAVGYGQDEPIASNDTEEGRQENRRVEIVPKETNE